MAHLARVSRDMPVQAQEIANAEGIPRPALAKVLQQLARNRLVLSFKGPGGGFRMGRPPAEISLYEILAVVDGVEALDHRCAVGLAECDDLAPCPLHDSWKAVRVHLREYLKKTTLAEMATAVERKKEMLRRSSTGLRPKGRKQRSK